MTDRQIEAADLIIKNATLTGVFSTRILDKLDTNETEDGDEARDAMKSAAILLQHQGFIEIEIYQGKHMKYSLKPLGLDWQKSGKSYSNYLAEQKEREERQREKEEIDMRYKLLQAEKLEKELRESKEGIGVPARKVHPREYQLLLSEKIIEDRRRRLKIWAIAGFVLILSIILVPLNYFFFVKVFNWNNYDIYDPFTWVNPEMFAKGELVISLLWIGLDSAIIGGSLKVWGWISNKYFSSI